MTELETLLLRHLEQQQTASEQLVNALSKQLERLQTAQNTQQRDNDALRQDMRHQQAESERLVSELSAPLQRLQTALSDQQSENAMLRQEVQTQRDRMQQEIDTLRQEVRANQQITTQAFEGWTKQFNKMLPSLRNLQQQLEK